MKLELGLVFVSWFALLLLETDCFFVRGANPFHPRMERINPPRDLFIACKN